MNLARKALLIVVLLAASAATAHAECAWVLWMHSLAHGVDLYRIELARPTQAACVNRALTFAQTLTDDGYRVVPGTATEPEVFGSKGAERVRYFCLPDTIDPRGAKK